MKHFDFHFKMTYENKILKYICMYTFKKVKIRTKFILKFYFIRHFLKMVSNIFEIAEFLIKWLLPSFTGNSWPLKWSSGPIGRQSEIQQSLQNSKFCWCCKLKGCKDSIFEILSLIYTELSFFIAHDLYLHILGQRALFKISYS